jgi:hypothetical protein
MGRRYHRECASGRSKAEDLQGGKNLQRSGREKAGLPAGEIFSQRRLRAGPAGSSA